MNKAERGLGGLEGAGKGKLTVPFSSISVLLSHSRNECHPSISLMTSIHPPQGKFTECFLVPGTLGWDTMKKLDMIPIFRSCNLMEISL